MKKRIEQAWSEAEDDLAMTLEVQGKTNLEVANAMGRTESSVKNRLSYLRNVMGLTKRTDYKPRNQERWPPKPVEWPVTVKFEDVNLPPSMLPRFRPVYRSSVFSNMGCAADMCAEA